MGSLGTTTNKSVAKILLLFLLLSALCACQPLSTSLEISYIANEGYLIQSGSKTVLIDAMFNDRKIDFCDIPPSDLLEKMEQAQDPFDAVEIMLVTHVHRDHFAVAPVCEHLQNNTQCMLVCPTQVVERLEEECDFFEEIRLRVMGVSLELNSSCEINVNGIQVQAHRMKHCQFMEEDALTGKKHDRHANTVNLVYLVDMGNASFLHMGDAVLELNKEYIQSLDLADQQITAAFLEFFERTPASKKIIEESIKPKKLVFMHLPSDKELVNRIIALLKRDFSNAIVLDNPMEKVTIR